MVPLTTRSRRIRTRRNGALFRGRLDTPRPAAASTAERQIPPDSERQIPRDGFPAPDGFAAEPPRPAGPPVRPSAQVEAGAKILPEAGGAPLLTNDLRAAFLLLNDARYRTLERLFGVGENEANLLTAVIALMVADKAGQRLAAMAWPGLGDVALGLSGARALVEDVAGPSARETPLLASLVTLAVLGASARPAAVWSSRTVKVASHRLRAAFNHRYGDLSGPHTQR